MNPIACTLTATLALQGPAPAPCPIADNACKGPYFERRAADTEDPKRRALYLHAAHRSYLSLFDETGKVEHLCAARRLYDRSVAVKEQPERQRASFVALLSDLTKREKQHGARCGEKSSQKSKEAPLVAKAPPLMKAADPAVPRPVDASAPDTTANATPAEVGAPAERERPPARVALLEESSTSPEAPADLLLPVRRPPPPARPRNGRPLVIAGSVTLLGGAALATAAGVTGGRLLTAYRGLWGLNASAYGSADADQLAEDSALRSDFRRLVPQVVTLALTGGSMLVVGAVLAGVGGRRMARSKSGTTLSVVPGGLVLRAQF